MSDFDHAIPTENDNSNQVDERSDAQDARCTEAGSNTQGEKRFTRILTNTGAMMAPSMM